MDYEADTYEEFLTVNFGSDGAELGEILDDDLAAYATLGFDEYLDEKASNDLISADLADYLQDFYGDLSGWISVHEPVKLQLDSFLTQASARVDTMSILCPYEKYQSKLYHKSILGFYGFMQENTSSSSIASIEYRSCNWWQAIICGAGGIVVGTLTLLVGEDLILGAEEVDVNGNPLPPGKERQDFATSVSIVAAVYAGISFYNWCCSLFEKDDCSDPYDKIFVTVTGCNEYILSIATNSGGEVFYIWTNENMIPAVETTTVRSLLVEADNPALISQTTVQVMCFDSGGLEADLIGPKDIFLAEYSESPPPTPSWLWAPPSNATINTTHKVAVLISPYEYFDLEWSAPYGGATITPTGEFSAEVTFTSTGSAISLKAKVTNTCTGGYSQLSSFVNVTN